MTPERHFFEPQLQPRPDTQSRLMLEGKQMRQGTAFIKISETPQINITQRKCLPILHESEKIIFYTKDVYF